MARKTVFSDLGEKEDIVQILHLDLFTCHSKSDPFKFQIRNKHCLKFFCYAFLLFPLDYCMFLWCNQPFYLSFQDHESIIKAIYAGSEFVDGAVSGNEVGIVLESTSFYAEQGGQVQCHAWFKLYSIANIPRLNVNDRCIGF